MLFWFRQRKDGTLVSDASARYEGALKDGKVLSLPFEATQHEFPGDARKFVLAVGQACATAARELLLLREVQLEKETFLVPAKRFKTWLPALAVKPNERNQLVSLNDLCGAEHLENFARLLEIVKNGEGVYELAPGIAVFGGGGKLRVTASRDFIRRLNNE